MPSIIRCHLLLQQLQLSAVSFQSPLTRFYRRTSQVRAALQRFLGQQKLEGDVHVATSPRTLYHNTTTHIDNEATCQSGVKIEDTSRAGLGSELRLASWALVGLMISPECMIMGHLNAETHAYLVK
jgi:hypothetical protein